MGWLYGWNTRKALADQILNDSYAKTVRHCFVGNDLWVVHELQNKTRFICLYMLRNGGSDGWGYKDITSDMGPTKVNCPLSYLDLIKDHSSIGYTAEWMERVRRHQTQRRKRMREYRARLRQYNARTSNITVPGL